MGELTKGGLPGIPELESLLGLELGGEVDDLVTRALLDPLEEFLGRPSKKFRGRLVTLGFQLAGATKPRVPDAAEAKWCDLGAELLEAIHAASLVVDDIQDMSAVRRGAPTLHRQHGVAVALNAGNWLYFWPLEKLRTWNLDKKRELECYRLIHQALLRAHFGQALDVGVPIDSLPQARIPGVCLASLELKTGALMGLALSLGATLGEATPDRVALLAHFAQAFGVALQMFDDLGNLKAHGAADPKRFEDLQLRRPSWVWAAAAKHLDETGFAEFRAAVQALPEAGPLEEWLARSAFRAEAHAEAAKYLESALAELRTELPGAELDPILLELRELGERLGKAYE